MACMIGGIIPPESSAANKEILLLNARFVLRSLFPISVTHVHADVAGN